jgi:hypothetical protein
MATFYDIYQNYLQNPYSGVNALPGVNPSSGIMNTNTISPIGGDSMGVSPVASINTNPNVTNTTPGTGIMGTNVSFSDIGKFLNNPVVQGVGSFILGGVPALGNFVKGQIGAELLGRAISPMIQARLAAEDSTGGFRGPQAGDLSYTDYSDADIGPMGPQAGDNTGNTNTNTGNTGFGDDNDGYGNDGDSSGVDSAGDGGDGYATGGRVGYAEGGTTTYLTPTEFFETSDTRKEWAKILDELDEIVYSGQYANPEKAEYIKNLEDKKNKLYAQSWDEYYKSEADAALKQQTTPTEDFSDYLNTTTINTNVQTAPTVAEQMMSPEDALTPLTPDINPLQQHFDQNQMLKDAVARGEITPEQYNELGGYDVQQTLSPGNPLLGGIGNLIGSTGYNIAQSLIPSKDSSGNVIYEDTPFIIGEDANTIYSQTPKASQLLRDIPGDVMRNVRGGLGLISPELKQTYQDIIQQRAPANITEHINTAISSFNPFQQQQYMNYAVQNPEQAIAAAQQNKDFLEATRKNIAPTVSSPFLNAPKTPIGLFPGGGGGQTTPLIDEGPKTPIGLFPNRGGSEIKPLMADGGRVFYLQGGLASLLG